MFLHQASGLYLTKYRAYDPYSGRWLSRNPVGERYVPNFDVNIFNASAPTPAGAESTNLSAYVGDKPTYEVDPLGLYMLQYGISSTFQFGPVSAQFTARFAADTNGNFGTYYSAGPGAGLGDELSGGLTAQVSNAPKICDLSGLFTNVSAGGDAEGGGSGDSFFGSSNAEPILGTGGTIGVGLGAGGSTTITATTINPIFSF